ncbi:MAG: methyltransferase domain-containing protein [Pyrinomonadaceae bacterium]|nr:methyltransferase domain-containing protein [Pyrinomonadaceae bacterium]
MHQQKDDYIPALGYDRLTPLYDSLIRLTMPERAFKHRLIEQARIMKSHRILDLGCGTATLTLLIKETHPEAAVVGMDGDPKILNIAERKAREAGLNISFDRGMSFDLPYPDTSFDRVLTSLVIHHLTHENKVRTLNEVHRVLRDGGELHVADFGKPHNALMLAASLPWRIFDGFEATADNAKGLLPEMMRRAGFIEVHESARYMTLFGTLSLHVARKP